MLQSASAEKAKTIKQFTGRDKNFCSGRQISLNFNYTFLLMFLIRVVDFMHLVSLELIFRVSVDPIGLDGPTLSEAGCK